MPVGAARAGIFGSGIAIPDIDELHSRFDMDLAVDSQSVPDQTGNQQGMTNVDAGGGIPQFGTRNGLEYADFTAQADQEMESSFNTNLSRPYHIFFTAKFDAFGPYFVGTTGTDWGFEVENSEWDIFAGNVQSGGTADKDWHIFEIEVDKPNTGDKHRVKVDGTEVINTTNAGDNMNTLDGIGFGSLRLVDSNVINGRVGEMLIYPSIKSNDSEIRDYLKRWI